jgi:hypothetical protein
MKKLVFLSAGILAFALQNASAQTFSLFTTTNDFSTWNNGWGATTVGASSDWDYDGSAVNGQGNNTAAGGVGTPGSLAINANGSGWTLGALYYGAGNPNFMHAIDPGSLAAYNAESPGGSGNPGITTAFSGYLQMVYTVPINEPGGFALDLFYAYDSNGGWGVANPSSVVDLGPSTAQDIFTNPQENYLATYNYSISAGALQYFNLGLIYNPGSSLSTFYVDAIIVPEPGTAALFGLGALGFAFLARRRRA